MATILALLPSALIDPCQFFVSRGVRFPQRQHRGIRAAVRFSGAAEKPFDLRDFVTKLPKLAAKVMPSEVELKMSLVETLSADSVILAFIATVALREAMLAYLPASVVGPAGWLLRTDERSDR